jgi:DNA adenine methylase
MSRPLSRFSPLSGTIATVLAAITEDAKPQSTQVTAKPFVKWVGGKRSILPELESRIPNDYTTYREHFLGGGALFFSHQPKKAQLSDINFHLICTYKVVQEDVDSLMKQLDLHQKAHTKDYFLQARKQLSAEKNQTKIAGLFIYLNKTCFNGLYRVNKSGEFNVPMGDYKECVLYDEANLRSASVALKCAKISTLPYSQNDPQEGDFFYLDPPYHRTFDQYSDSGFSDEEHRRLASMCKKINSKGARFLLSNSDTPFVRELYKDFHVENVNASRSVSCKSSQRGRENELLIRNY